LKYKQRQLGFTLIEIIVVVAIVALLATVVSVSVGSNGDRHARLQAQRFVAVVNSIQDEAIVSGGYFALTIDEKSAVYRFRALHDTASSSDEGLSRPRQVTHDVKLNWEILESLPNEDEDADPQVLISGLGEITLFEARFGGDDTDYVVFVSEEGVLDVREENARIFN